MADNPNEVYFQLERSSFRFALTERGFCSGYVTVEEYIGSDPDEQPGDLGNQFFQPHWQPVCILNNRERLELIKFLVR